MFGLFSYYAFLAVPLGVWLFLYYVFFEAVWQRTPGKFITGTKVVTATGSKPSFDRIGRRSLARFVPFEVLSVWNEKVLGWHDRWTGTYVIRATRLKGPGCKVSEGSTSVVGSPSSEEGSGAAIASLALSYIPFLNVVGLFSGLVALIRRRGRARKSLERRLGFAGLTLSAMFITLYSGLLVAIYSQAQKAAVRETEANLQVLCNAVAEFKSETGRFPAEEEGFSVLSEVRPVPGRVIGDKEAHELPEVIGSVREFPEKDGWGHDFVYKVAPERGVPFLIMSLGADGKVGGEGYDADLVSGKASRSPTSEP
jgi:type II secretion system protein G